MSRTNRVKKLKNYHVRKVSWSHDADTVRSKHAGMVQESENNFKAVCCCGTKFNNHPFRVDALNDLLNHYDVVAPKNYRAADSE